MLLVSIGILISEEGHVVGNVSTEEVLAVNLGIERLGLRVVASKAADAVGDGKTTIDGTLEDTKDAVTSGGAHHADIQEATEGLGARGGSLNVVLGTIRLLLALVGVSELQLRQKLFQRKMMDE